MGDSSNTSADDGILAGVKAIEAMELLDDPLRERPLVEFYAELEGLHGPQFVNLVHQHVLVLHQVDMLDRFNLDGYVKNLHERHALTGDVFNESTGRLSEEEYKRLRLILTERQLADPLTHMDLLRIRRSIQR